MSRFQKVILIIGFLVVVFLLGFLLYLVFFRQFLPVTNTTNIDNQNGESGLPLANEGREIRIAPEEGGTLPVLNEETITELLNNAAEVEEQLIEAPPEKTIPSSSLTQKPAFGATLSSTGSELYYYDRSEGKFFSIDRQGKVRRLSDKIFHQVETVIWSPKKNQAILEYPDGANIVYDFDTEKQITLPQHWRDFQFTNDGKSIVSKSIGINPENRFLIISDTSGKNTKILRPLGNNADNIITAPSPDNQVVALFTSSLDLDRQEIFFIGRNNENFKTMIVEGRGFQGKWSPQGDKMLYSVYNAESDYKPELWVSDARGNAIGRNRRRIRLQTWANKCTFYDNTTVYCAVPTRLESGAGLFQDELDNAPDVVYKINILTGSKILVGKPENDHTMKDLIISKDGRILYFTDKQDGKIYTMNL